MAMIKLSTKTLKQAASAGALALAAVALTGPTVASAQDNGRGGGWQGPGGGEMRGGGEGRGGGFQNRGGGFGGMGQREQSQPRPQAQPQPQPQQVQAPQQAPQVQADRGSRWQGNREAQGYRGDRGNSQHYPRNWTPAQRETYRGAVLEGRDTDQFRNQTNRPNWRTDRPDNRPNDGRGPGQWQGNRDGNRWDTNRNGWNDGRRDGYRSTWQTDRRGGDRNGWQNDGRGRESWRNNGSRDNRNWDRDWRSNNRYDWSSYRSRNRNIFSAGRYYSPFQNYSYRRIGIGFSLGSQFYGSRYLINDPYYYRLPEAYGPYRWVRYYDDVLLIDTYSGEVVDAIYDFFY